MDKWLGLRVKARLRKLRNSFGCHDDSTKLPVSHILQRTEAEVPDSHLITIRRDVEQHCRSPPPLHQENEAPPPLLQENEAPPHLIQAPPRKATRREFAQTVTMMTRKIAAAVVFGFFGVNLHCHIAVTIACSLIYLILLYSIVPICNPLNHKYHFCIEIGVLALSAVIINLLSPSQTIFPFLIMAQGMVLYGLYGLVVASIICLFVTKHTNWGMSGVVLLSILFLAQTHFIEHQAQTSKRNHRAQRGKRSHPVQRGRRNIRAQRGNESVPIRCLTVFRVGWSRITAVLVVVAQNVGCFAWAGCRSVCCVGWLLITAVLGVMEQGFRNFKKDVSMILCNKAERRIWARHRLYFIRR